MLIKKMAGIVVALVVIALATTLTATGVFAGDNPKERPFSAPMEGTFAVLLETCVQVGIDLQCTFELHGEGNATHLGKFGDDSTWLVQIDGAIVDPASTRGSIVSGTGTLTAANGDTVRITADPGSRLDDGTINAPFNITGGTGRFARASGIIIRSGVFSITDPLALLGEFEVSYEGTITY